MQTLAPAAMQQLSTRCADKVAHDDGGGAVFVSVLTMIDLLLGACVRYLLKSLVLFNAIGKGLRHNGCNVLTGYMQWVLPVPVQPWYWHHSCATTTHSASCKKKGEKCVCFCQLCFIILM